MSGRVLPAGDVTFLLTDIEGSTALFKRLGSRYEGLLAEHNRIVRDAIRANGGVEVRSGGDGFVTAFESADAALAAAVEAQLAISAHAWPRDGQLKVRMGLHRGEAKVVDDDYVSLALHQASRVAASAHGGQILVSPVLATIAPLEHASLEDLGPYWLRDFDEPQHLHQVRHPDLASDLPPPRAPSALVHNLPTRRTSFVGRDHEIEQLSKLIDRAGLVTLVGPGGVGKTRLASELGLAVAGSFEGGVWLIGLGAVATGSAVLPAVTDALDVPGIPGADPFDLVVERLSTAANLLIFDNCEHVVEEAAELIDKILGQCPTTSVVATSREPLELADEHVYRVDPLPLPQANVTELAASRTAAVELFEQRAVQADHSFELDDANVAQVVSICRELDGIPLALELTAARVTTTGVGDLASGLTDVLDASRRGGEGRQRTVRTAIAWSYDLLDEMERDVFRRLSVFRGGFTAVAAVHALTYERVFTGDIEAIIGELVHRSLVDRVPGADPVRYRMLEPIRRFGLDALVEADEWRWAHVAQLSWALTLTDATQETYGTGGEWVALADIGNEIDNLRAALSFAFDDNDTHNIASMIDGMKVFWVTRDMLSEGIGWTTTALETKDLSDEERAHIIFARAELNDHHARYDAARLDYAEADAMFDVLGVRARQLGALAGIGMTYLHQGNLAEARGHLERALEGQRELGDEAAISATLTELSTIALSQGDVSRSRAWLAENIEIAERTDNHMALANAHAYLGYILATERKSAEATAHFEEAAALFDRVGDRRGLVMTTVGLGRVAFGEDDAATAAARFAEAVALTKEIGDRMNGSVATRDLGNALVRLGRHAEARVHLADALHEAIEIGSEPVAWTTIFQWGLSRCAEASFEDGVPLLERAVEKMAEFTVVVMGVEKMRLDDARTSARAALGDEAYEALCASASAIDLAAAAQRVEAAIDRSGARS